MKLRKIKENTCWMGCVDWDSRLFDSHIPPPDGTSYNAYLIEGSEQTALLDTAGPPIMAQLEGVSKIDYVISKLNRRKIGGYSNWRLPNIREIESITDMGSHSPALCNSHPFQNIGDGFWSSTTSVFEPSYAWILYTQDGAIGVGFKSLPEFYICAVSSGS